MRPHVAHPKPIGLTLLAAGMSVACSLFAGPDRLAASPDLATPALADGGQPPAASQGLPFQDEFQSPGSGWEIGTYDNGSLSYGPGYYAVSSTTQEQLMWGLAGRNFGDVAVDVDATQVSAPSNDNNAYGVMCRAQQNDDGYLLRVSGDGLASITRILDGTFEDLVEWAESSAVRTGNATNHLHAVCQGSHLALTVNGTLVAEADDTQFTEGDLGLTATTFESDATEIHYENLVVTLP